MIYVEVTIIDLRTHRLSSKWSKQFDMIDDFNKWYNMAKEDISLIINVMKYNPMDFPLLKQLNDVRLLSVARSTEV